jgi:flagellar hook-length control protein FliK
MKKLPLLIAVATLSILYLTACTEEKAANKATEAAIKPPVATEQVAAAAEESAAKPSTDAGEKKAAGDSAAAPTEVKDEKKAKGGAEPDCN